MTSSSIEIKLTITWEANFRNLTSDSLTFKILGIEWMKTLSKTLISESVCQWHWASVKKASSAAAILSSSMKPLIQNDMRFTWLMSSNGVTILDKNFKKKNACWMCNKHYYLEISTGFIYELTKTWCTKSAIWQEHMVKRKDILHMSLVLLSNHEILQRNIIGKFITWRGNSTFYTTTWEISAIWLA